MVTTLQKNVMKIKLEKIRANKPVKMGQVILQAGGSQSTAKRPKIITDSKGYQELEAKYLNEERALKTLYDLTADTNEDKDNRFKASVEVLKLKDRYPATKSKIIGLFDKISSLEE